jgi:fumarate reductase flavoprotein subunit
MAAAARASQEGLDVILLEKMSFTGGATHIAGGKMVVLGSQWQRNAGVTDDTPQSMINDFLANGNNLNYIPTLTLYANNIGRTVDWLIESLNLKFANEGVEHAPEYSHDRVSPFFLGGAAGLGKTLREGVNATSTRLMLETRAESLIMESGSVAGVNARGADGTIYTIRAKNVLLATGGFGNNVDMLSDNLKTVLYYGPMSSMGDGHRMAREAGAKFQNMEYGKLYPNGIEVAPRIAKSTVFGSYAAFALSGILVNKNGERVVNESASNRTVLTAQLAQSNRTLYLVMDAANFEAFRNSLGPHAITPENVTEWLNNNGSKPPLFVSAAAIEEAASRAGINSGQLRATVDRYNSFVRNGRDGDFGRAGNSLKVEIGAGPYYIVAQEPRFATTMGGVVINDALQVISGNGSVIPRLYAAGELVGGVMGDDSPSGANIGWALTSGRLAAESIAAASK